jgi:hypothetical protein
VEISTPTRIARRMLIVLLMVGQSAARSLAQPLVKAVVVPLAIGVRSVHPSLFAIASRSMVVAD